jgi:hypothetical protein
MLFLWKAAAVSRYTGEERVVSDYKPLNLEPAYTAGIGFIKSGAQPKIGLQSFHGLPFQIGADPDRCLLGFTAGASPVTLPVHDMAYTLIIAHALLESRIMEGEPIGHLVAHYLIGYAGGETLRIPIRERFEIGVVPTALGQWPFLALPEQPDSLPNRYAGNWEEAGFRQTESVYAHSNTYYLWPWRNPHPDRVIESLTVEPADRTFFIAAITLGHVDEEPFTRQARRPVKISIGSPFAGQSFQLDVTVDRGLATYAYPLPLQSAEAFLNDKLKGCGTTRTAVTGPRMFR